jgi:Zn-dependent M32 family carboxypeptidase
MRWLTTPEIKCVLETKVKDAGGVAIHESQSFVYENPLDPDQDYLMTADLAYQTNPQRMILTASVVTPSEVLCLQMVTILRIITAAETVP